MYRKAVQTPLVWAFAYEVPMGGYALSVCYVGAVPMMDDEPQFVCVQALEDEMQRIAPLSEWSETLFERLSKLPE
jgi:hypothetical protein